MKTILPAPQRIITKMPRAKTPEQRDFVIRVVVKNNLVVAVILPVAMNKDEMRLIHCMFPDHVCRPALSKRWSAWGVMVLDWWSAPTDLPPTVNLAFTAANLEHCHD